MTLSPSVGDIALAQIGFPSARGARLRHGSLGVSARAPFGDDYLAAGAVWVPGSGDRRVLVLLANRATDLADPVSVRLRASALGALGRPRILRARDPFTRPSVKLPALCDLPLHGGPLAPSQLLVLAARGTPLKGFSAAGALAQAYDSVCHLPYSSTFKRALAPASGAPPSGNPPAPSPTEPLPSPPGCTPCAPPSQLLACPLALPAVCVSPRITRAAAAGAH